MEMDSGQLDHNKECIEYVSADQLLSSGSPVISDIFGDPQVLPRVGAQYQVEVPPLITESDCLHLKKNPSDKDVIFDAAHSLLLGLPISIMWINNEVKKIKHEPLNCLADPDGAVNTNGSIELEKNKESQISTNNEDSKFKVEPFDVLFDFGKGLGGSESPEPIVFDDKAGEESSLPPKGKINLDQNYKGNDYSPVPGSLDDSWSVIEQNSFLLGLYIFGKNLVQVKNFIETKKMGDILSFYYGRFYRTEGYCRWSECRRIRSKKCIYGQRIFTGWRQQELLARLLPGVSEECRNTLLEVWRIFGEGKLSLEEYVYSLKTTVGMHVLIEAVGIGKGKQDLTGIIMEPIKPNQVFPLRPEIPIGKACSNLTSGDIIKFLTGDFRLSKARSNDLFWEAVWPRLLARGWHSEQPKNHGYTGSRHSLVFLIPGVKKFSRRRLVKGNHYFDSVSDVLNKVAADPGLLEFEVESAKDSVRNEEFGWDAERKLDEDGFSDRHRHCYLRPRTSNCNPSLRKFTIVDTSLVNGEEPYKVIELRSLPVDTINASTSASPSSETDVDTSDEPLDEPDSTEILLNHRVDNDIPNPINGNPNNTDYLAPVMKRRRLSTCGNTETRRNNMNRFSVGSRVQPKMLQCQSNLLDAIENKVSLVGPSHETVPSTSSSVKGSPGESNEGIPIGTFLGTELSHEKAQPRTLIDLNLPHVMPDFQTGENFIMEVEDSSANRSFFPPETSQQQEDLEPLRISDGGANAEQQPIMNVRRQSTRNRPLTTRALEALACGFINSTRRRRGMGAPSRDSTISRPYQRSHGRVGVTTKFGNISSGSVDFRVEEGVDGGCRSTNMVGKSQVQSEKNDAQELLGVQKAVYHPESYIR